MASLRKFPRSDYFYACFTAPDGRRLQRSTKEKVRKLAQAKADQWEKLAKEGAKASQAVKVISEIYRVAHSADLPNSTVRSFVVGWLARREGEVAPATYSAYNRVAKRFLDWLGDGADRPLAEIGAAQFVAFRDEEAKRVSVSTVNKFIKILRVIFESACRDGFLNENPASTRRCPRLKKRAKVAAESRRPFTIDELKRLLALADAEMRSLILFGLYTGQRLGDLAKLTWANLDLQAGEIFLSTAKTGRVVRIPITQPLLKHIESLEVGDLPNAPLHPRAANSPAPSNSTRFRDLLAAAGVIAPVIREKKLNGDGTAKRSASQLSFHSLRYTATSIMKNAGISPAVVQDIIGHESSEMSAHYTIIENEAKARALETLPDLTA